MKPYRLIALAMAVLLMAAGCGRRTPENPTGETVTMIPPTATVGKAVTETVTAPETVTVATTACATTELVASQTTTASGRPNKAQSAAASSAAVPSATGTIGTETTAVTAALTTHTTTATSATATASAATNAQEVRAAWVSYIELDELLQVCSTASEARSALNAMMKQLAANRINTVFFHVRANSDAYYSSSIFQPAESAKNLLQAGFDPLAHAVEAAHACGMKLHAWVNPYRIGKQAVHAVSGVPTLKDEAGKYYYVPTSTAAQKLIVNGVREIVTRYAVDGIQYDDYFYPEDLLEENTVYGFESEDYTAYCAKGGKLSVGDWRRAGVDNLIAATHAVTAAQKVVFGVSPAVSAEKTYTSLYADCRKWLSQAGYVDYLCPQIYTGFCHDTKPFKDMVDVWNHYERHASVKLYVGLALYKIGMRVDSYAGSGKTEWATQRDIMKRSVQYLRNKHIAGLCFYSYSYFQPAQKAGFSSEADVAVAEAEIKNLLSVL